MLINLELLFASKTQLHIQKQKKKEKIGRYNAADKKGRFK